MPDHLRISAHELRRRIEAGEEFTLLDARNPQAWAEAPDKAAGAIRVSAGDLESVLPGIPRDTPIAAYCT